MTHTVTASAWRAALVMTSIALSRDAWAGDARIELGTEGAGSSWRTDAAVSGTFRVAYRFAEWIGPYAVVSSGYGSVDQRMMSHLGVGARVWLPKLGRARPQLRLGLIHQHEQALSVVLHDSWQAAFGVGDSIRHRAGGELGAGLDLALVRQKAVHFYAVIEGAARLLPDPLGPAVYGGGSVALGVSFDFGRGAS
jgi:hypothetical protein